VRENRTPRFPEEVIAALLAWSLRYVTVFATIFSRPVASLIGSKRAAIGCSPPTRPAGRRSPAASRARLKAYFARRAREGRGVPIWTTAHNGKLRIDPQHRRRDPTDQRPSPASPCRDRRAGRAGRISC
jgi:hypothetical protein